MLDLREASVTPLREGLANLCAWFDKAVAVGAKQELVSARLAEGMPTLADECRLACETACTTIAALTRLEAPNLGPSQTTFAGIKDSCCVATGFVLQGVPEVLDESFKGPVTIRLPDGTGYRMDTTGCLSSYALPTFYFHLTMAYAILRASGVPLEKADYLGHMLPPEPV